jgi:spore maturation protein CgeB
MAKATLASAINLNVLRMQNKNACNMRTFEIPGCGGFMLHERSSELPGLFRPGIECDDFGTADELRRKIDYYLSHAEERARIASAGRNAALRQTYTDWAAQVLAVHARMRAGGDRPAGPTA